MIKITHPNSASSRASSQPSSVSCLRQTPHSITSTLRCGGFVAGLGCISAILLPQGVFAAPRPLPHSAAPSGHTLRIPLTFSTDGAFWTSAGGRKIGEPIICGVANETMTLQDFSWCGPLYLDFRGFKHGGRIQVTGMEDVYKGLDKKKNDDAPTPTYYKHSVMLLLVPRGTIPPSSLSDSVELYKHGGAWGSSGGLDLGSKSDASIVTLPSIDLPFFGPRVYCLYYGIDHYGNHDTDYQYRGTIKVIVTHKT